MEKLLEPHFSWTFFGFLLILASLGYLILRALHRKINDLTFNRKVERIIYLSTQRILVIYEPLAVIILASIWVLVNPVWHGILMLFLVASAFPHVRNYVTGRLIRLSNELSVGKNIIVQNEQGTISQLAPLGVYIMMNSGLRYFNYNQLAKQGYTIVSGSDLGEYCTIAVTLQEENDRQKQQQWLIHMLMASPYIDSNYPPKLLDRGANDNHKTSIKLLLHKGNYHNHLTTLINDWGYPCQLTH